MRKEIGVDKDAHWYGVINLKTGRKIKNCIMADDEKGIYWQEKIVRRKGFLPRIKLIQKTGNIKLVKNTEGSLDD